jgi:hypothetical protein
MRAYRMRDLVIYERGSPTDRQLLTVCVTDGDDLVLEGVDTGETPQQIWGDADYEYSRTVVRENVPAVLLWLVKERFDSDGAFAAWLQEKGISEYLQQLHLTSCPPGAS